jgi:hypothetical protein
MRITPLAIECNPGKFYNADPFILRFTGLLILIGGPDNLSVDTLVQRFTARPAAPEATISAI